MLTKKQREEIIDKLNRNSAENVMQFALNDYDSLLEFVAQAENFDELDDDTLINIYENNFGTNFTTED